MSESTSKSKLVLGIIALVLVCMILATLAGATAGGIAGYFVGHQAAQAAIQRSGARVSPNQVQPLIPQMPNGWGFGNGNGNGPITGSRVAAQVSQVTSGSPAEKAGLRTGDLITAVNGQALSPNLDLAGLISQHKPGDQVTLTVQRSSQQRQVHVTLGENPDQAGKPYLGITYRLMLADRMPNLPSN